MEQETKPNDGAFAVSNHEWWQEGLTKREYFAAMAMQGIIAAHAKIHPVPFNHKFNSEQAVKAADALIEALNKK